jgi:hypothetical protein
MLPIEETGERLAVGSRRPSSLPRFEMNDLQALASAFEAEQMPSLRSELADPSLSLCLTKKGLVVQQGQENAILGTVLLKQGALMFEPPFDCGCDVQRHLTAQELAHWIRRLVVGREPAEHA